MRPGSRVDCIHTFLAPDAGTCMKRTLKFSTTLEVITVHQRRLLTTDHALQFEEVNTDNRNEALTVDSRSKPNIEPVPAFPT